MNEQSKFEKLVMVLAEASQCGNIELDEEISKFEDAIDETGYGKAHFGTAKADWDGIEIVDTENIPYKYRVEGTKYFAEYYDGMQAPFIVCKWNKDIGMLVDLLKVTSPVLYKMFLERLEEQN